MSGLGPRRAGGSVPRTVCRAPSITPLRVGALDVACKYREPWHAERSLVCPSAGTNYRISSYVHSGLVAHVASLLVGIKFQMINGMRVFTAAALGVLLCSRSAGTGGALVPLNPFETHYWMYAIKRAIFEESPYCGVVVSPSFKNFYALDLKAGSKDGGPDWRLVKFTLSEKDGGGGEVLSRLSDGRYKVEKKEAVLPCKLAERLFWVSREIVKQARYSDYSISDFDGVTYMFNIDRYAGSTTSPIEGASAQLISLWGELNLLVEASTSESRVKVLVRLEEKLKDIQHLLPSLNSAPLPLPNLEQG